MKIDPRSELKKGNLRSEFPFQLRKNGGKSDKKFGGNKKKENTLV